MIAYLSRGKWSTLRDTRDLYLFFSANILVGVIIYETKVIQSSVIKGSKFSQFQSTVEDITLNKHL